MRPLPRLLALTDDRVAALPDLGIRAAAVAAAGPMIALGARLPHGSAEALATLALKFRALAAPPMAQVTVTGRSDVAAATRCQGVILRRGDLAVSEVRHVLGTAPVLASVHSAEEAEAAVAAGSDGLVFGTIWETASHPGRGGAGLAPFRTVASLGVPVWAIGGVTIARAEDVREAGGWGVAVISAVWDAADPYQAALALTRPWRETGEHAWN